MLDEIIKLVAKKANLNNAVASIAVDTVIKALKDKLPPAVGASLNSLLSASSGASKTAKKDDPLGGLGNLVGGLLGGKK